MKGGGAPGFLLNPQTGPRDVAKRICAQASRMRSGQFGLACAEKLRVGGEQLFEVVPRDRGHFSEPRYEHVLRGLGRSLPQGLRGRSP